MPPSPSPRRIKRVVDLVLASALLVLAAPAMAAVAVAVRLDSPGPALFVQRRVGLRGREFRMFKFRSMCIDAEQRLAGLAHLNVGGDHLIRIPSDPRVTRLGSLLRRTSLDELPQLLNVLRGDMSLVGPRPCLEWEAELFPAEFAERFSVRPGLTGLWQVTGRSTVGTLDMLRMDVEYVRNRTPAGDLAILLATLPSL